MLMLIGLVAMEHGDTKQALGLYWRGLNESMSYGMAAFYFDLAVQQGDQGAIEKLQTLLKNTPPPRGTTQTEWQQLRDRIDDQVREFSSIREDEARRVGIEVSSDRF